jgi:hypothetical protein
MDHKPSWPVRGIDGQDIETVRGEIEIEISDGRSILRWRQAVSFLTPSTPDRALAVL